MFWYGALLIATLTLLKPVRNSLFINTYGVDQLPTAFFVVALVAALFAIVYTKVAPDRNLHQLVQSIHSLSVVMLIGFWYCMTFHPLQTWIYYLFYIWVAIYGVIITAQFWLMANLVFLPREAKSYFSFLGTGAIVGGIAGGYTARLLVDLIGSKNLLLLVVAMLLAGSILVLYLWKSVREKVETRLSTLTRSVKTRQIEQHSTLKQFLSSKHLLLTTLLIVIAGVVANLVDYQFSEVAARILHSEDELTAFFGVWASNLSLISLALQLFATGRIIRHFGIGVTLALLPMFVLLGALSVVLWPVLWAATGLKVGEGAIKQSLNRAGMELLALPVPIRLKQRIKPAIDLIADHAATGIGGVLLILLVNIAGFSAAEIAWVILLLSACWAIVVRNVHRQYLHSFRVAIEKRSLALRETSEDLYDRDLQEKLLSTLRTGSPRTLLHLLQEFDQVPSEPYRTEILRLVEHNNPMVRAQVFKLFAQDRNQDLQRHAEKAVQKSIGEERMAALLYLASHSADGTQLLTAELHQGGIELQIDTIRALGQFIALYSEQHSRVHFAGIVDLIKRLRQSGTLDADEKKDRLNVVVAEAIGEAGIFDYSAYLHILLRENSRQVKESVLRAAGKIGDQSFAPILIEHLELKAVRFAAMQALATMGGRVLPLLETTLRSSGVNLTSRIGAARVLGMIGEQSSADLALRLAGGRLNLVVRDRLIKSLSRLRRDFPDILYKSELLNQAFILQTKYLCETAILLAMLQDRTLAGKTSNVDPEATRLLVRSLQQRLAGDYERLFRLIGLRYPSRGVVEAYYGYSGRNFELRANAIEYMDNLLHRSWKRIVIPLLENSQLEFLILHHRKHFGEISSNYTDLLRTAALEADRWIRCCLLYWIARSDNKTLKSSCRSAMNDPDPMIAETAQLLGNDPSESREEGSGGMLTMIERVLFLQGIDIFDEVPAEELAHIASISEEIDVDAGDQLFHEGDLADAMYILLSGKVRVERDGEEVMIVGPREAVGAWSLFDEERCVVTATTLEDCELLRIDREEFIDLLGDHTPITQGVLKKIMKRLRKLMDVVETSTRHGGDSS